MRLKYLVLALLNGPHLVGAAPVDVFRVFSYRAPAIIQRGTSQSILPSRDFVLEIGDSVFVGAQGGITFDYKRGSTISVIGPALFRLEQMNNRSKSYRIVVEYGDYYVKAKSNAAFAFATSQIEILEEGYGLEFYTEVPLQKDFMRLRNRNEESIWVRDEEVLSDHTVFLTADKIWLTPTKADDFELLLNRHYNNRHTQDLGINSLKVDDPKAHVDLSGFVNLMPYVGTGRLLPTRSTFQQNIGLMGLDAKIGNSLYVNFPTKPMRLDYLYAFAMRFGVAVGGLAGSMRFNAESDTHKIRVLLAQVFVGASFHGASADVLFGFPYFFKTTNAYPYQMRKKYTLGLDLGYRLDLAFLTESESGLLIGARVMSFPFKFNSSAHGTEVGIQGNAWSYVPIIPILALSMRF